mgnify:FL=1
MYIQIMESIVYKLLVKDGKLKKIYLHPEVGEP